MKKIYYFCILVMFTIFSLQTNAQNFKKGFKYLAKGEIEDAYKIFYEGLNANPNCPVSNYGLAVIYSEKVDTIDFFRACNFIQKSKENINQLSSNNDFKKLSDYITSDSVLLHVEKIDSLLGAFILKIKNISYVNRFIASYEKSKYYNSIIELRDSLEFVYTDQHYSINEYDIYLKTFPNSKYCKQAIAKRDFLIFEKVKKDNKLTSFKNFITDYPNSEYIKEAKAQYLILDYNNVEQKRSISECIRFINEYPNTKQSVKCKELLMDLEYKNLSDSSTVKDYDDFLYKYPDSKDTANVRQRILKFQSLNDINIIAKNSVINRHLQNNLIANTFLTDSTGKCYLLYKNILYYKCSNTGDEWCNIAHGIINLSIDPKNNNIIYAIGTDLDIAKSMDGGHNWITIQNGLPTNLQFHKLLINPHNNSEIFLSSSNGIYKTSDAGFTWQPFKIGVTPLEFIIHSTDKNKFYLLTTEGLNLSTDAGLTWKIISNTLPKTLIKGTGRTAYYKPIATRLFIDVNYSDSAFILSFTDKGLYKTYNDGQNWTEVNNGIYPSAIVNSYFLSNNEIYLGCRIYEDTSRGLVSAIYKSDIYGSNWKRINVKLTEFREIEGIYKDKNYSGIFINSNGKIAYIDSSQNVIGLNYGVITHSVVRAFASIKHGEINYKYAITDNNNNIDIINHGFWFSKNNGITWENSFNNLPSFSKMIVSPFNMNEVWSLENDLNFVSMDGGASWFNVKDYYNISNIIDLKFDPINKNILYYTSGNKLHRYDRTTKNSTVLCESGENFVIDKTNNKKILTKELNLSTDAGWTWKSIYNDLGNLTGNLQWNDILLPISIEGDKIIIARLQGGVRLTYLKSDNSGENWIWKSKVFDDNTYLYINPENSSNLIWVSNNNIYMSINDIDDAKLIFAVKDNNILELTNEEYNNYEFLNDLIKYIYVENRVESSVVYICTSKGLIYTNDEGKTWKRMGGIHENK